MPRSMRKCLGFFTVGFEANSHLPDAVEHPCCRSTRVIGLFIIVIGCRSAFRVGLRFSHVLKTVLYALLIPTQ